MKPVIKVGLLSFGDLTGFVLHSLLKHLLVPAKKKCILWSPSSGNDWIEVFWRVSRVTWSHRSWVLRNQWSYKMKGKDKSRTWVCSYSSKLKHEQREAQKTYKPFPWLIEYKQLLFKIKFFSGVTTWKLYGDSGNTSSISHSSVLGWIY